MNSRGSALVVVMIAAATVAIVGGTVLTLINDKLSTNKTYRVFASRDSLASTLDQAIKDTALLNASLYNAACVKTSFIDPLAVGVVNNNALYDAANPMGPACLILRAPTASPPVLVPVADPNYGDDAGFYTFDLKYLNTTLAPDRRIAGTVTNPVYYDELGQECLNPNLPNCTLEAIAMFRYSQSASPDTVGPYLAVRYRVRPNQLLAGAGVAFGMGRTFSAETEMPLATLSRIGNPTTSTICRVVQADGSLKAMPGWVSYAVKPNLAATGTNPDTNSNLEEPACVAAIGISACPTDQFQVGINADGTPVCGGYKGPCEVGEVPVGSVQDLSGGVKFECMKTNCASTNLENRVSFVAPYADGLAPGDDVNCVTVRPKTTCLDKAKTTVRSVTFQNAELDCQP